MTARDEEREEEMWKRKKLVVIASLARKSEELYRMRSSAEARAGKKAMRGRKRKRCAGGKESDARAEKKAMRAWLVQRKMFALLYRAGPRKINRELVGQRNATVGVCAKNFSFPESVSR